MPTTAIAVVVISIARLGLLRMNGTRRVRTMNNQRLGGQRANQPAASELHGAASAHAA